MSEVIGLTAEMRLEENQFRDLMIQSLKMTFLRVHSGGCFQSVENDFKENCAGVVDALRGLIIDQGASLCIEL